jgi:hypothetical protein
MIRLTLMTFSQGFHSFICNTFSTCSMFDSLCHWLPTLYQTWPFTLVNNTVLQFYRPWNNWKVEDRYNLQGKQSHLPKMSPDPPAFCHPLLSDFSQFVPAGLPWPTAQHHFLTAVALVVILLCAQQIKYSVIVAIAAQVNGHHHQCLIAVSSLYWF